MSLQDVKIASPSLPIIEMKDKSVEAVAKEITKASQDWGFLLLGGHDIPEADIEGMFCLSRKFFVEVPDDDKRPWAINSDYIGYIGPYADSKQDDKGSMWMSGKPRFLAEHADSLPPFWRDHVDRVEAFKHSCFLLVQKLLVCFALAMDLPDRDHFAKAHREDAGKGNRFRLLCYPARSSKPDEAATRMSEHSDSGSVTLLFQTCAGLEVKSPTNEWRLAPHLPGHILVNLGDALAFWSGRRLKATKHRVTFKGVPHNQERLTMAYFGLAAPDTVLEPVRRGGKEEAMGEYKANGLVLKPGITVGEYSDMIMTSIYGKAVAQPSAMGDASA
jgi:isopenicillin N synthase-like dioxygenase